jgi:hypothetical protein
MVTFAWGVCNAESLPPNPLRPSLVSSESELPAAARPSVVPQSFGQPELLPPVTSHAPPSYDSTTPFSTEEDSLSNFVHPLFDEPWFPHSDPNDPHRHVGLGQPLVGTSWRNRPWFFGTLVGGVMMDDLVPNRVYQNDTTLLGVRLGYDFDHFWGLETRWAYARPDLADGSGVRLPGAGQDYFTDVSLVVYPFGDARWRPYFLAGLGFQSFRFNDDRGHRISELTFEMPLGCGVKYFYGPWFSLRFDLVDNLSLGNSRLSGMNNVSLMMGGEFRFGGRRPSYFPWHSNTAYW